MDRLTLSWFLDSVKNKYSYRFKWLGRPIIQYPQDMMAVQEIMWNVKPDLVIETGIAHGGSLIFYASLMEIINKNGMVLGIDVDIREHNRVEIEKHEQFKRIKMIEGSSISPEVVQQAKSAAKGKKVLLLLDSNHTHDHVLQELELYSSLVKAGSYIVVFDTIIEDMPAGSFPDRPWDKGNNPKTAVYEFLKKNNRFEVDRSVQERIQITVAPDGYLRCIKD